MRRAPRLRYYTNREGKLETIMDNRPSPPLSRKPGYRPALWLLIAMLLIWGLLGWAICELWPR